MQAPHRMRTNKDGPTRFGIRHALRGCMTLLPDREPFQDDQTGAIIGAAIDVHIKMGRGFLEPVYRECLAIELSRRRIPYAREVLLPVAYDGIPLPCHYRVDFIGYEAIIIEVKALGALTSREQAQVMNYLRASGLHRGLLLNFGANRLEQKRVVWNLEDDPLSRVDATPAKLSSPSSDVS
jgi:GxxExxY protein